MSWTIDRAQFSQLVAEAVRAPSVHNSQPWRFRLAGDAIELRLDPDRVLPVSDPTGRGARMSCGAALYNLRLALAVRGTPAAVAVHPDPHDQLLLGRLTADRPRPATPPQARLHAAIARRRSNRQPFADTPVPAAVRTRLADAARDEAAWIDLITNSAAIEAIAKLVATADETLNHNPAYRAELAVWTRTTTDAPDGVPTAAGGPAPKPHDLLIRRDFGGEESRREYERDPLLGVLGGYGDTPADHVQAGMALQRILLTATDLGLACSMFTQPIDVPATRDELRTTIGRSNPPHMLLRFGYAVSLAPTARRHTDDVIIP